MRLEYNFRELKSSDFSFYKALHDEVLRDYVEAIWGWDDGVQAKMVGDEFEASRAKVIQAEGVDIGFVQIDDNKDHLFISQLWIKPSHQNQGIGTDIVQNVMRDAKAMGKHVRLYVLKTNRAQRLYDRLGFIQYGEDEGDYYMKHEMQNVAE